MALWYLTRGRTVEVVGTLAAAGQRAHSTNNFKSGGGSGFVLFGGVRIEFGIKATSSTSLGDKSYVAASFRGYRYEHIFDLPLPAAMITGGFEIEMSLLDGVEWDDSSQNAFFSEYVRPGSVVTVTIHYGTVGPVTYTFPTPTHDEKSQAIRVSGMTGETFMDGVGPLDPYCQITAAATYSTGQTLTLAAPSLFEIWPEPQTGFIWKASGASECAVRRTGAGTFGSSGIRCTIVSNMAAGWDIQGRVYAGKDGYTPTTVRVGLTGTTGQKTLVPITPDFQSTLSEQAEKADAGVKVENPATGYYFQKQRNIDKRNPYQSVSAKVEATDLNAIGETHPSAQVVLAHLWKWDAMRISKSASRVVDDGTTLSPANGTWAPTQVGNATAAIVGGHIRMTHVATPAVVRRSWFNFESDDWHNCFRYLRVKMIPRTADGPTVKLRVYQRTSKLAQQFSWKEWSLTYTAGQLDTEVTKDIDLCSPERWGTWLFNPATNGVFEQEIPLPIYDADTSVFPLLEADGAYWGISNVGRYEFTLPVACVIDFVSASQIHFGGSGASATKLSIFMGEEFYPQFFGKSPNFRAYTDGKVSLEGYTVNVGLMSIRHLVDQVNGLVLGDKPLWPTWQADWFPLEMTSDLTQLLSYNRPAVCLGGRGVVYGWGADDVWKERDVPTAALALTIPAQLLAKTVTWQPGMGDVVGLTDSAYGTHMPLRMTAVLRTDIEGIVLQLDGSAASGATVDNVRATDNESGGTGLTNVQGVYTTGLPRGKGGSRYLTRVTGTNPANARTFVNHYRYRMCLRAKVASIDCVEVDSPRGWVHGGVGTKIRTWHQNDDTEAFTSEAYPIDKWLKLRTDPRRGLLLGLARAGTARRVYLSNDGGLTATEVLSVTATSAVIERDSERGHYIMLWENGGNVQRQISTDGGLTWSAADVPTKSGLPLTGTLLDAGQDHRPGVLLIVCAGAVLASEDLGKTWVQKLA